MTMTFLGTFTDIFGGLAIGTLFGFILQKAGVTKFTTIKKQLLLEDFTVMKVILTAIASGSLLLYLYRHFIEHKELIISTTTLPASFFGGAVFGVGMAILGYCPGTCIGSVAEKSKGAVFGLFGMLMGAFLYNKAAPYIQNTYKPEESINKSTLHEAFNTSPLFIIIFLIAIVTMLFIFDKNKKN